MIWLLSHEMMVVRGTPLSTSVVSVFLSKSDPSISITSPGNSKDEEVSGCTESIWGASGCAAKRVSEIRGVEINIDAY